MASITPEQKGMRQSANQIALVIPDLLDNIRRLQSLHLRISSDSRMQGVDLKPLATAAPACK
jgi:hypothetical protein